MIYDSTKDTQEHIEKVRKNLKDVLIDIAARSYDHDKSKLEEPEKSIFDEYTPKLRDTTYGSDEYREYLEKMGLGLKHHYQNNTHHPEHYENGINGMSLLDVIEMLADWKAATKRHADGDIMESLKINKERFGISDQLYEILVNTVEEMAWEWSST